MTGGDNERVLELIWQGYEDIVQQTKATDLKNKLFGLICLSDKDWKDHYTQLKPG